MSALDGAPAAVVVHDGVAQQLVEPGGELGIVLHFAGVLQGLQQAVLQDVLRLGLAPHARREERPEGVPVPVEFGGELGGEDAEHHCPVLGLQVRERIGHVGRHELHHGLAQRLEIALLDQLLNVGSEDSPVGHRAPLHASAVPGAA